MNGTPRLLGGRYEVGAELGRGGMAEVHVALDTRLGRNVAVKLLRPDLARDPSFQARFRREAQSAASLNHPAVVAVYDTGEDVHPEPGGGQVVLPYIVMEYVEGRTLRDLLRAGRPLALEEALGITEGVLGALEYSHRMGIVHRDIKPANVMVAPSGEIKVMDFGIARAISDSSATLTQTAAVMGTAQYLSPEQARGEQVDARSDIYSTGCLLYEILTGRPPFTGEAPVAVAYQHVSEQPKPPSTLRPEIPPAVDQVVLMALAKDRTHRYQSAADFADDLRRAVEGRPLRGAVIAGAGGAAGAESTRRMETLGGASAAATTAMPSMQPPARRPAQPQYRSYEPTGPATGAVPLHAEEAYPPHRRSRWPWVLLALLLVGAIAIAGYTLRDRPETAVVPPPPPPAPTVELVAVPAVAGMDEEEAREVLVEAGFEPVVRQEPHDTAPEGEVVQTNPAADAEAEKGTPVEVIVSSGPAAVEVPVLYDKTQQEARRILEEAGLGVDDVKTTDDNPEVEKGKVVFTDPRRGTQVARGESVVLYIASGRVEVPDVVNQQEAAASTALQERRLTVRVETEETDDAEPGTVIEQSVDAGTTVDVGTSVTLTVARASEEPSPSPSSPSPSPTSTSPSSPPPTEQAGAPAKGKDKEKDKDKKPGGSAPRPTGE
ncbi:serine/threonine-protein kinase [Kineococcus xinjiangensis]|uniref:non-specific serine/threonine protein kinase n=1 Tax=Kineococcus xinjiangensis TaxID=512762 RepID=A0A2S6IJ76_9ACTN|nr:Stk1 family PASTA domain-containing Ser/Thr kinase [Kineococcus xinjiangensis]PPK94269.1 serine/threonine-protein kinase [Kineococcus xinjiangensis]